MANETSAQSAPLVASRPWRHLVDFWLVAALFICIKGVDNGVDKQTQWALGMFAAVLAGVWLIGRQTIVRRWLAVLLGEARESVVNPGSSSTVIPLPARESATTSRRVSLAWCVAGLLFVIGALVFLEQRQPYYFVQDDNLSQFLPVVLHGCRSLFDDGVFATWNPYQFLGSPTASLGTYALTYPPTYVAYGIARWVLRDEFATFEVFCMGHLLLAYCGTFWAARLAGIRPSLAAVAGLCFALSGFFLIAGRSWFYMTPTAAWLPLLAGLLEQFRRQRVGWPWVLCTGGVLGALLHAGNVQMWAYAGLFVVAALGIFLVTRAVPLSRAAPALAALCIGATLALPLLVPLKKETGRLDRYAGDGLMFRGLPTFFLPYPLAQHDYPGAGETPDVERMGHMNYSGSVFALAALLGLASLVAHRWSRGTVAKNWWLLLAALALVAVLGRLGGLWYLLAKLPLMSGFKHPFKFVPLAVLPMLIGGALLLHRALREFKFKHAHWAEWTVCGVAVACMAYHVHLATPSFCDFGFRPYGKLPADMQALHDSAPTARIYAIAPRRSFSPEYALSMMHQWPTLYQWPALEGYDPLVRCGPRFGTVMENLFTAPALSGMQVEVGLEEAGLEDQQVLKFRVDDALRRGGAAEYGFWGTASPINVPRALAALRAYGVRWVAIYHGPQNPKRPPSQEFDMLWQPDPVAAQIAVAVQEQSRLVLSRPEVKIYELAGAAPLAFVAGKPKSPLPASTNAAGLRVDLSSLTTGGDVVVNTLPADFLVAEVDGNAMTPTTDRWGRAVFAVPAGSKSLKLAYRPPWLLGGGLGLIALAAAVVAMKFYGRDRGGVLLIERTANAVGTGTTRKAA